MSDRSRAGGTPGGRRQQILESAAGLFAERGYAGTSIDDIGRSVGASGPSIYWHFASKEALLSEMLVGISTHLLDQGTRCVLDAADPSDALDRLLRAHVSFALDEPALITVHTRELGNLPDPARRQVRRTQRLYTEEWVGVLAELFPDRPEGALRVATHAAFGLMNSTPHLRGLSDRSEIASLLRRMALAALTAPWADAGNR